MHFAADISGVQRIGLDAWLAGEGWPVRDAQYNAFLAAAFQSLDEACLAQTTEVREIIEADYAFFGLLCQIAHWQAVAGHCHTNGLEIVGGAQSSAYLRPDWDRLAQFPLRAQERWSRTRRQAKRALLNGHLPLPRRASAFLGNANAWMLGTFGHLQRALARQEGLTCDFLAPPDLWPQQAADAASPLAQRLAAAARALTARTNELAREHLGAGFDIDAAAGAWSDRLARLDGLARALPPARLPQSLLIGEIGRPLQRIVGVAARRAGRRVYGFHHGNATFECIRPTVAYTNYPSVTHFVSPTQGMTRQHRTFAKQHFERWPVEFVTVLTGEYDAMLRSARAAPPIQEVGTVMIVGMAMNAIRYLFATGTFFAHLLHYELRALELLRSNGFKTIYKMHPETAAFCGRLFEGHADEISTESFEKVFQRADAFLFGVTSSTTFGFALATNRPVIALDLPGMEWNAAMRPQVERRVSLIPARFGERNWIEFDADRMLQALREPRDLATEFVDEMMG